MVGKDAMLAVGTFANRGAGFGGSTGNQLGMAWAGAAGREEKEGSADPWPMPKSVASL